MLFLFLVKENKYLYEESIQEKIYVTQWVKYGGQVVLDLDGHIKWLQATGNKLCVHIKQHFGYLGSASFTYRLPVAPTHPIHIIEPFQDDKNMPFAV